MQRYLFLLLAILLFTGCSAPAAPEPTSVPGETLMQPPVQLSDFTLPSNRGEPLSLSDLRGKTVLLFFGYTFCPDVCPTTLSELARVKKALGPDGEKIDVVFISVDPERDTPEVLARHMSIFDPDFIGLQGEVATLRKIGKEYGLYYEKRAIEGTQAGYLVDHSSATYVIDKEGRLRIVYAYDAEPEVVVAGVKRLLSE